MKNRLICKALAVAVILLFIGLAIQPSVAVQPETEMDIEPKDYLFQTIIDIANNPEVKNLLGKYSNDLFKVDIDRSVYRKLFLRNQRLFRSLILTKPSLSVEYLDKCYNNGVEITDILGEDKVLEIIENVEVTDTKLFDEFKNIITKDEELSNRLETLKEMNSDLKSVSPFEDHPIICSILFLIYDPVSLFLDITGLIFVSFLYNGNLIFTIIFGLCLASLSILLRSTDMLLDLFGCW